MSFARAGILCAVLVGLAWVGAKVFGGVDDTPPPAIERATIDEAAAAGTEEPGARVPSLAGGALPTRTAAAFDRSDAAPAGPAPRSRPTQRQSAGDGLLRFLRLNARRGVHYEDAESEELPEDVRGVLEEAATEFLHEIREIDARRMTILEPLRAAKRASGAVKRFPHPSKIEDAAERARVAQAFRDAKQPTRAHQSVSSGGNGTSIYVLRIDAHEHPDLPAVWREIDAAEERYVARLTPLLAPHLRFTQR